MLAPFLSCLLCLSSPAAAHVSIMEIQGRSHVTPYDGDVVVTQGVVTAITPDGFFLQDPVGDGDPATSDGLFVSAPSDWDVRPGDAVEVDGVAREWLPGDDPDNLTLTEIDATGVVMLGRNRPLPARVVIGSAGGAAGRLPPRHVIDDDGLADYQPASDGLDFYESLEAMRVEIEDTRATSAADRYGDVWVVPSRATDGMNARGGVAAQALDANPERVHVAGAEAATGGASIAPGASLGNVTGILTYGFGSYDLLPDPMARPADPPPSPEHTVLAGDGEHVTIASFNMRNFAPSDRARAGSLAGIIVSNLGSPDVLALEEIQDDSGPADDGAVAADATLALLVDSIVAAGGPAYDAREVPPSDGADGGEPGGNIRVAFLFRPDRIAFVDRSDTVAVDTLRATYPITTTDGVHLTQSPGRVDPADPAWTDARKPLAGEFVFGDTRLFVIGAHFRSKSGSSPSFGAIQPPRDAGAVQRAAEARVLRAFVGDLLRRDAGARVVVLGDFNDDAFSLPLAILEEDGWLTSLARTLPGPERYSYLFEGEGHEYDHVLVSPALGREAAFDVVHVAAEYADGASDHDPVVARLSLAPPAPAPPPAVARTITAYPNPSSGAVDIAVAGTDTRLTITIYDVRGEQVRTLVTRGGATTRWNGHDQAGRRVASGVYFIRVAGAFGAAVRRTVLLR